MFTEYHLEKIIQAINDAEERQTQAIVAAIKEATQPKPKPVFMTTPKGGLDMFEQAFAEAKGDAKIELIEEERFGGKIEPMKSTDLGEEYAEKRMKELIDKAREQKKTSTTKKPTATKKPAPVRGRN